MNECTESGQRQNGVLILRPRETPEITQHDLAELKILSLEFDETRRRWQEKRDWIRTALENGAAVEAGYLRAHLVEVQPSPYSVNPRPYKKLVLRG